MINVNTIVNTLEGIAFPVITAFGVYIIKKVGDKGMAFLANKELCLESKKNGLEMEQNLSIARMVVKGALQDIAESKDIQDLAARSKGVEEALMKRLPGLTQEEARTLVQAVKHEEKEGNALLNADTITQQVELVKTENTNLKLQNEQLQKKISSLNTLLNPTVQGEKNNG